MRTDRVKEQEVERAELVAQEKKRQTAMKHIHQSLKGGVMRVESDDFGF